MRKAGKSRGEEKTVFVLLPVEWDGGDGTLDARVFPE